MKLNPYVHGGEKVANLVMDYLKEKIDHFNPLPLTSSLMSLQSFKKQRNNPEQNASMMLRIFYLHSGVALIKPTKVQTFFSRIWFLNPVGSTLFFVAMLFTPSMHTLCISIHFSIIDKGKKSIYCKQLGPDSHNGSIQCISFWNRKGLWRPQNMILISRL